MDQSNGQSSTVSTPIRTGPNSPSARSSGSRKRHLSSDVEETGEHVKKRACNECRQQKLKCDVKTEPPNLQKCSRCSRLKLDCRIDANFKRVGKRSKTAQMEKEIVDLRKQLAEKSALSNHATNIPVPAATPLGPTAQARGYPDVSVQANYSAITTVPHEGVAGSLLALRNSTEALTDMVPNRPARAIDVSSKSLGDIRLDSGAIRTLFQQFFEHYHAWLPILDPDKTPEYFYDLSPLLFWTVIAVSCRRYEGDPTLLTGLADPFCQLVWSTISLVPQNYHVAKSLAILCTWPLPTKSTSTDQTFMLAGLMMQIALQTGLHRPAYAQDFSRGKLELKEEEIRDRLRTWAVCNIVAQNVSTGWGQPPITHYDFTLTSLPQPSNDSPNGAFPAELYWRLQIERFSNKVSRMLYNNKNDPIGIASPQERAAWISLLEEDYDDLEQQINRHASPISHLHLQAVGLSLRLSAFFDPPSTANYVSALLKLYFATTAFLISIRDLHRENSSVGSAHISSPSALKYASRYLVLMALAAGFTFMKLLNSFFARHMEIDKSRALFNTTIHGIRSASVANNDLEARLAEVLAQLWRYNGAGMKQQSGVVDGSLQLRVTRRMSMSLVYDSVWQWRQEFQFSGDGTTAVLDSAVNNPTDPEIEEAMNDQGLAGQDPSLPSAGLNDPLADYSYEVFDPMTWMLDGSFNGLDMSEQVGNMSAGFDGTSLYQ